MSAHIFAGQNYGMGYTPPKRAIHKYLLTLSEKETAQIPEGAKLLTVQLQGDRPVLWAMVNPDAPKVERLIRCYCTGTEIPEYEHIIKHLGTVQQHSGMVVYHFFEVAP